MGVDTGVQAFAPVMSCGSIATPVTWRVQPTASSASSTAASTKVLACVMIMLDSLPVLRIPWVNAMEATWGHVHHSSLSLTRRARPIGNGPTW